VLAWMHEWILDEWTLDKQAPDRQTPDRQTWQLTPTFVFCSYRGLRNKSRTNYTYRLCPRRVWQVGFGLCPGCRGTDRDVADRCRTFIRRRRMVRKRLEGRNEPQMHTDGVSISITKTARILLKRRPICVHLCASVVPILDVSVCHDCLWPSAETPARRRRASIPPGKDETGVMPGQADPSRPGPERRARRRPVRIRARASEPVQDHDIVCPLLVAVGAVAAGDEGLERRAACPVQSVAGVSLGLRSNHPYRHTGNSHQNHQQPHRHG